MSIRYSPYSNSLQINSNPIANNMARQSQGDIDQMIQRAHPTNRDLVRRDIVQSVQSPSSSLILKLVPYYYPDGNSKELLCLNGTVSCEYRGSRYNIPVEIWLQQDHPHVPPLAYVRPTSQMYVSTTSQDVQPDGTIVLPYLKKWRHPQSDLVSLINQMSESFSRSPPVYSGGSNNAASATSTSMTRSTPYPLSSSSMPSPHVVPSPSLAYPNIYPGGSSSGTIPVDVYRHSLQTAVLEKVRHRLNELTSIGKAQVDSLKKNEQDLLQGEKQILLFIQNAQQQQQQAQKYLINVQLKLNEMSGASERMSLSSKTKEKNEMKDDALITPAPVYKQLVQCYSEEHAIQDVLFYLADGLRRRSIPLDVYLKHVRDLSRRQFLLRATMHKCRQVAGLPVK